MSDKEMYTLMEKYDKLAGTIEKPLFSDRQFVKELKRGKEDEKRTIKGKLKAWGTIVTDGDAVAIIEVKGKGEVTIPWGSEINLSWE